MTPVSHRLRRLPIGVLIMAYGGPSSLAEMPGYLADIRSGRPTSHGGARGDLPQLRGDRRPLAAARDLAPPGRRACRRELDPAVYRCYLGMRHWAPWIEEVVGEMLDDGITHAVSVVLAPHLQRAVGRASTQRRSPTGLDLYRGEIALRARRSYHDRAAADRGARGARGRRPLALAGGASVTGCTSSSARTACPSGSSQSGDPYDQQLRETARLVAERAGLADDRWSWSFQSAGRTPEPWLGPQIDDHIAALAAARRDATSSASRSGSSPTTSRSSSTST